MGFRFLNTEYVGIGRGDKIYQAFLMGGPDPIDVPGNDFHGYEYILNGMVENAASLSDAIELIAGPGCRIEHKRNVSGGDINTASILTLSDGRRLFLKGNSAALVPMFAAEASGLVALISSSSRTPPVPGPLAWGAGGSGSFLLMEVVEPGRLASGEAFGESLAELHRLERSDTCGFNSDNWIGSTPQMNGRLESWYEFFAERRLGYQWRLARKNGYGDSGTDRKMESLLRRLPELLPDLDEHRSSLLHGDLWGGNWMAGADGRAWLIDPAVYYGHREADIAMTELFGGFPAGFREGYRNTWPMEPGFSDRRNLYNLYHLLNHLNLFGSSYWSGVRNTLLSYA